MIYEFYLAKHDPTLENIFPEFPRPLRCRRERLVFDKPTSKTLRDEHFVAILRVNRQLYNEALPVLYCYNSLVLCLTSRQLAPVLSTLNPIAFDCIRKVDLCRGSNPDDCIIGNAAEELQLLESANNIRELHVELHHTDYLHRRWYETNQSRASFFPHHYVHLQSPIRSTPKGFFSDGKELPQIPRQIGCMRLTYSALWNHPYHTALRQLNVAGTITFSIKGFTHEDEELRVFIEDMRSAMTK